MAAAAVLEPAPEAPADAVAASDLAAAAASINACSGGSLADYVIEKAIGRGHFSVVHRAVRRSDERRVALKKVQIFDMLDAKARDRCLKEVQLLKSLPPHPCIIQYLDSFIDNNELYIVFEWAEHGDLRRLLRRANESKTSLQEAQVWRYFVQIADGIRHMHEARIMHRDIKPANIFLSSNGSIKLGDLGLGRAFSSQTYEALSKVGTPLYMSPEVLDGRGYEWKSDVWSLGCLLYELATLRSPFKAEGDNLYTLFKKISVGRFESLPAHYSPQLQRLVTSMIQIDPKTRPDVKDVLGFATKALQALDEEQARAQQARGVAAPAAGAAAPGSGGGGVAAAAIAIADCLIVMEAVGDKLKLLDYEVKLVRTHGLAPLPCAYFTGAAVASPEPAQLEYLYTLVCWLLSVSVAPEHKLWSLVPRAHSPTYDADASAACAALLETLGKAPAPLSSLGAMPPHRLRSARGAEVCAMLNALTDAALAKANFVWAAPMHRPECEDDVEEAEGAEAEAEGGAPPVDRAVSGRRPPPTDDGSVDDDDGDGDGGDDGDESDLDDAAAAARLAAGSAAGRRRRRRLPYLTPSVAPALWYEEATRVAPSLSIRVHWQQLHWRHRLALAATHAPTFTQHAPAIEAPLEALASSSAAKLRAVAPLQAEHEAQRAALEEASEAASSAQQRVDRLANELAEMDGEIARAKQQGMSVGVGLSDAEPLERMRRALKLLREEVRSLALRQATAQQRLTSAELAEGARRGQRGRGEAWRRRLEAEAGAGAEAEDEDDEGDDAQRRAREGARAAQAGETLLAGPPLGGSNETEPPRDAAHGPSSREGHAARPSSRHDSR